MTIVTVRDGVIASDSMIGNELVFGYVDKIFPVKIGNWDCGYIGVAGDYVEIKKFVGRLTGGELEMPVPEPSDKGTEFIWLDANGVVNYSDGNAWFEIQSPCHAIGSGLEIALGAMHAGANAEQAVKAAIDLSSTFSGKIVSRSVG